MRVSPRNEVLLGDGGSPRIPSAGEQCLPVIIKSQPPKAGSNASDRRERAIIGSGTDDSLLEVTHQCSEAFLLITQLIRRQSSDDRATIYSYRCSVSFNPTTRKNKRIKSATDFNSPTEKGMKS